MILTQPSILITDDDRGFRDTLRGVFDQMGFRTLAAGDGEEALQIVTRDPVHVLLIDMHMPRLTGLETVRRIKELRSMLPCILMSANADDQLVHDALMAQAFSVLRKPISRGSITGAVCSALERAYNWRSK